jgi:predicted DNA-binding transcriptional regulator AlpA
MSNKNATSDLLLLARAAEAAGLCRTHFWRLFHAQLVPPPIMITTLCRWSRHQIELWLRGLIRRSDDGIWLEWDPEIEKFRKLPNQYVHDVSLDAA